MKRKRKKKMMVRRKKVRKVKKLVVGKWTPEMEKFLLLGEVGPTIKDVCTTVVRREFNREFKKRFSSREIWMKSKKLQERVEKKAEKGEEVLAAHADLPRMSAEVTEVIDEPAPAPPVAHYVKVAPSDIYYVLVDGKVALTFLSKPKSVVIVKEIGSISV